MSGQQQPLGEWVNRLFDVIFFQPDDNHATNAYTNDVDPSFIVRINHTGLNYEQYKDALRQARTQNDITLQSSSEILKWDDEEKKGGTVGHLTHFTLRDKITGQETKSSSLILSAVKWIDNKRKLTEMTEVAI